VRSDILPVLAIGGHAVHIPYAITWAHEEAEAPDEHYRRINSVLDLPPLLAAW
jgi:putative hydrolase of the HAD superfamily